ncbi:MAG: ribonuclease H-like domain-containing protein, partial [Smithellaceae bacterium]|nr:ribonuclease H-like domain-containing protein [Smithellaceae bacterium]
MTVIQRLKRQLGESLPPETKSVQAVSGIRRRLDEITPRPLSTPGRAKLTSAKYCLPLGELVRGEEAENHLGKFFLAQHSTEQDKQHILLRQAISGTCMDRLAMIMNDQRLPTVKIEETIFLDTETTGLSGGSGTFPFMIGLGFLRQNSFLTRQIFCRDYSEEPAALACLREEVKGKRFLVTFNGKAFDLNLLAARYIINRQENPFTGLIHLDLLHESRRLLSHRLDNHRLTNIEEQLLGIKRTGDLPGAEIPGRYFAWLSRRDPHLVKDIFKHNRLDVLSLAALMGYLSRFLGCLDELQNLEHRDILSLARFFLRRKDRDETERLLLVCAESEDRPVRQDARGMLALLNKRQGLWERAVSLWEAMLIDDPQDLQPRVELAKWHEHQNARPGKALELVRDALRISDISHKDRQVLIH